jgi:hypothetical protein
MKTLTVLIYVAVILGGLKMIGARIEKAGFAQPDSCLIAIFRFACPLPIVDYQKIQYISNKQLAANHRITENDLQRPRQLSLSLERFLPAQRELLGKYVKSSIPTGEVILIGNLQGQPIIRANPGMRNYFVSLKQPNHPDLFNVNQIVDLCFPGNCVAKDVRVLAVFCDGRSAACSVTLEIPENTIPKVITSNEKSALQIVAHTVGN